MAATVFMNESLNILEIFPRFQAVGTFDIEIIRNELPFLDCINV